MNDTSTPFGAPMPAVPQPNGLKLEVSGNPGSGNTFSETNSIHVQSNFPSATTVSVFNDKSGTRLNPAYITRIVTSLSAANLQLDTSFDTLPADIEKKIEFNQLSGWDEQVRFYAPYCRHLNRIYQEFDGQGRIVSTKVLQWLNKQYLLLKDQYQGDALFTQIYQLANQTIENDPAMQTPDQAGKIYLEDISFNLTIVLVDAFMKCFIMNKPR